MVIKPVRNEVTDDDQSTQKREIKSSTWRLWMQLNCEQMDEHRTNRSEKNREDPNQDASMRVQQPEKLQTNNLKVIHLKRQETTLEGLKPNESYNKRHSKDVLFSVNQTLINIYTINTPRLKTRKPHLQIYIVRSFCSLINCTVLPSLPDFVMPESVFYIHTLINRIRVHLQSYSGPHKNESLCSFGQSTLPLGLSSDAELTSTVLFLCAENGALLIGQTPLCSSHSPLCAQQLFFHVLFLVFFNSYLGRKSKCSLIGRFWCQSCFYWYDVKRDEIRWD